ncbi:hypothetical protein M0638_26185 [Roseomonas sp. NAR14]|uniref:Uncharacterized protein n=1 Tax=Roseomonas acroporae TaxID=2937791 RepID=A0A9X1YFQ0_9PROT|nr:hypothetical protein [Roseomonas acroporae]MCK8787847.1 hypothetical protein [Roseomonas acroporae]
MGGVVDLRGLQDAERGSGAAALKEAASISRNMPAVSGAEAEMVAEFIVATTEPLDWGEALEAAHTSEPAFEAAVVLRQAITDKAVK